MPGTVCQGNLIPGQRAMAGILAGNEIGNVLFDGDFCSVAWIFCCKLPQPYAQHLDVLLS
jgi:hypothetical protein